MQEAFFFGPEARQLFGMYHPALGTEARMLTVICPPLFSEFYRTHSALRKLAISLADNGHDVLRMDFSGTGDSYGNLEDASAGDWIDDIVQSVAEGRELSASRRVRILAVRGSALFACRAAALVGDVDRLVLWDPLPDGAALAKALQRQQAAAVDTHHFLSAEDLRTASATYNVYGLSAAMADELRSLGPDGFESLPPDRLTVVRTATTDDFPVPNVADEQVEFECKWDTEVDGTIFSQPVLEKLLECLTAS